jgi:hypothetical protein
MTDLESQLMRMAIQTLDSTPPVNIPSGVEVVDHWQKGSFGGVLSWSKAYPPSSDGNAALHSALYCRVETTWRRMASAWAQTKSAGDVGTEKGPGLHKLRTTSVDQCARLVVGFASSGVVAIELNTDAGSVHRRPGLNGFCLFGIAHGEPTTHAYGIDRRGGRIPSEPLIL